MPAEWEPHQRVWLTWFGQERRDAVSCDIVKALLPNVKLTMNVASETMKTNAVKYMTDHGINASKLEFVIDPNVDFFVRDYAVFVKDASDKPQIVDFAYSAYGQFPQLTGKQMPEFEKQFGMWEERLAESLNVPLIKSDCYFEGGGIESNGRGTFLVIKDMAVQRNPDKTIAQIESELKRTLGARKIIWLEKGLAEDKQYAGGAPFFANYYGGGANMHIDELARFVNETTVVLPYVETSEKARSPVDDLNRPMLESNFQILQKATTADGKKLKIVRIPMPEIEQLKFAISVDEANLRTY
jgi:agmatine deiminase